MIIKNYKIWNTEEYTFPNLTEFYPNITTYIHDDGRKYPAILVVPGGGYCCVSCTEGEIVAKKFYEKGYNTFVLTYTTDLLMKNPLRLQPLKDIARSVVFLRKNTEKFGIIENKVVICGFSAGGHLCGSLAVHHSEEEFQEKGEYAGISTRPDAVILSYPVITSGEFGHKDSFKVLWGENGKKEELEYASLEKHVTENTPPVFLWHTMTDELVPVENSILFALACRAKGVPVELHIFGTGKHGMSVANEEWAAGPYTGLYTMKQFFDTLQYLVDNDMEMIQPYDQLGKFPKGTDMKKVFLNLAERYRGEDCADAGIAKWPDLVEIWLNKVL